MMTCENHTDLRWYCKEMAISDGGRYTGARNIFFSGKIVEGALQRFDPETHLEHRECACPGSDLIALPETMEWLKKNRGL